jgi:hypothetical protein
MTDETKQNVYRRWIAVGVCALLLITFAALSFAAVSTKSATMDEPLHAAAGFAKRFHADFRVNPEDPPLFQYWAMLPHDAHTLSFDTGSELWKSLVGHLFGQWSWSQAVLYYGSGNDPDLLIHRSRKMMLVLGIALGVVLASWSWKLGGPVAAVSALLAFTFDPGFLGHSPLVKNDVPITLVMLATMFACWSVGRRAAGGNVLLLCGLCAIAVNTKFSGLIVGPIVAITLIARAILKRPWLAMGWVVAGLSRKLLVAALICMACLGSAAIGIWASYGFRFAPTPDPSVRLNMPLFIELAARGRAPSETIRPGVSPSLQEVDSHRHSLFVHGVIFADDHRLLPHAWLAGLLDTHATTMKRTSYLRGQVSRTGWWYYFPLAMLYKTPTATLAAGGLAVLAGLLLRRKGGLGLERWSLICILVPILIYGACALRSHLNLGVRHVFPLYPFFYLLIGVTVARAISKLPKTTTIVACVLGLGLIVETARAFPNYIAFFNTPSGGTIGGFKLLGDSNLDWGQDLLLLQKWQHRHPDTRLYLSYFGGADPAYYLKFGSLPGNATLAGQLEVPREPGVFAISATHLQGMYLDTMHVAIYRELMRAQKPMEILGGTIYLYEFNSRSGSAAPTTQ